MLLRFEDIDHQRCRGEFVQATIDDLNWLSIRWDGLLRRQSDNYPIYAKALEELRQRSLIYPCFCTRQQIRREISSSANAPHGLNGELIYPGICRHMLASERDERIASGAPFAWRLDVNRAAQVVGHLEWFDHRKGTIEAKPELLGDVVLARKDCATSYHLAVVVDDHIQGVSLVTRGLDLFHATHIHRLLQEVLGLRVPQYYHHNLVVDDSGQRLAKRNQAMTIRAFREKGKKASELWGMLNLHPVDVGRL